jgi:hypothetical protein
MRVWILAAAAIAAWLSFPAYAGPHAVVHARPYVSFGYSYGYPYGYYRPYYSPWYGPAFGVGVSVGPRYPVRSAPVQRTEGGEQRALKLYVYPAAGQSQAQLAEDRYQCHVWGADQSGHDPTLGAGDRDAAENYTRAFTACMEGRGYVVK